jgi:hypothetical protein
LIVLDRKGDEEYLLVKKISQAELYVNTLMFYKHWECSIDGGMKRWPTG